MVFPQFLALPRVPRDLIIQKLDPVDILNFSFTSKKSLYLAKSAKVQVESFNWDFKKDGNVDIRISRGEGNPLTSILLQNFFNRKLDQRKNDRQIHSEIASVPIALLKNPSPHELLIIYRSELDERNPIEMISERLLEILKVKTFSCETNCDSKAPFYIFNFTKNFKKLRFGSNEPLTHEEARFLLEDLRVDDFRLNSSVKPGFVFTKPLSFRSISIVNARWFTRENLILMDCERLTLGFHTIIDNADIIDFIKKWKQGGFPKLQVLVVLFPETEWNLAVGPLDDKGDQVLKDTMGNVGKLRVLSSTTLLFFVNDAKVE